MVAPITFVVIMGTKVTYVSNYTSRVKPTKAQLKYENRPIDPGTGYLF
jgi:hypothetical protein